MIEHGKPFEPIAYNNTVYCTHQGLNLNNGIGMQVKPTVSNKNDFLPQTSDKAPISGALKNDNNPYKKNNKKKEISMKFTVTLYEIIKSILNYPDLILTNRLQFLVCVYCNRSQKTSQHVQNKNVRHETKSTGVTVVLYTLWRLL